MLKKSTSVARISAMAAAEGTSTMMPTGIFSSKGIPSLIRSSFVSSRISFAFMSSSMPEIMGNMIEVLP
ncbi:MAG: hypothetical protein BWZ01_01842 [Deltaproteobacteria bacterium ADurb.BinA179]|nr:MAG: hypothetical protein BWZ01_01842 [Deltaproteobacteria bacterium ADurb.BinA179]